MTDVKYAVSFHCGDFGIPAKPAVSLWCIDSDCRSCVIVLPKATYQLLDSLVTEYAEKHGVAATVGCRAIDTESPVFMPATMSVQDYQSYFAPISEFMAKKLSPPDVLAKSLIGAIQFVEHDGQTQTIRLWRKAKDIKKGDLYTSNSEGKRIEIYVTHLMKTEKPYSAKEILTIKLKGLFR